MSRPPPKSGVPYKVDGYHQANLDCIRKDVRKDYDAWIVVCGMEGYGKTTLALQSAFYCDPTFTLDRVCFTVDQFIDCVLKAEKYQAIVFDEAYRYLNSRNAMGKFNRILIDLMTRVRSRNLIVFLVIPSFFTLDWYPAVHRSTGLLYVYQRGRFASYDYYKKQTLYFRGKKEHSYSIQAPTFIGNFPKHFPFDWEAYNKKKDESITVDLREVLKQDQSGEQKKDDPEPAEPTETFI